jgi:hypothetical protein
MGGILVCGLAFVQCGVIGYRVYVHLGEKVAASGTLCTHTTKARQRRLLLVATTKLLRSDQFFPSVYVFRILARSQVLWEKIQDSRS